MELTARQKEIFNFIQAFIKERGYPPSIREIGEHFHIYPRAAFDHLKALERKGYLKRQGSMSRGIELLIFQGERLHGRGERPAIREIPVLGRVAAGKPALAVEYVEGSIPLPAEWTKGKEGPLEEILLQLTLDGANRFNPYIASSFARKALISPEEILKRIRIARAFTCYQMAALIEKKLPELIGQEGTGLPDLFPSPFRRLCCNPFFVFASDRRERGNLWIIDAL